ncbi:NAD-dependent epimerase/dehydratase family protein [Rhodococcoides yunnanense]|uniref:NAD-dependent epimerase/dehydratase family protein n=1 Tax=Rhodococcoides yunnanense TaxID=278209 RepID=UPI000934B7C6|nr:NAD-dependent epimerase/dehydratase family protein [Rhodococcus yunnanensis]
MVPKSLVIGASGFLGSHVVRKLVEDGISTRVMVRSTSSTKGIDDLDVEKVLGDIFDDDALRTAMAGCDVVYYCVVDARVFLRDPEPLFRTNVEGLRHVLNVALDAGLRKFVFTSTAGTLAISDDTLITEDDERNWDTGGPYIEARVAAEDLVLEYARERGLPAVAMCVSTTYGPRDWQPTPHGRTIAQAAAGKLAFYPAYDAEIVGIEDTARAMLLAAERGRPGERYIISDRCLSSLYPLTIAAEVGGKRPPRALPMPFVLSATRATDALVRLVRGDMKLGYDAMRIAQAMSALDHSKAERELGWKPTPVEESIRSAAQFYASEGII